MKIFWLAISLACLSGAPAWATNPVCPPGLAPFQITGPNLPQESTVDDAGNTWTFTANPAASIQGSMTCTPPGAKLPPPPPPPPPPPLPVTLAPGTYNFVDPATSLALDDGWAPIGLWASVNDSGQRLVWNGSKLQCVSTANCGTTQYVAKNASNATVVLNATGGTFTISLSAAGAGYTIKDNATGLYLSSLGITGAAKVSFTATPFVWNAVQR